MNKVIIVEGKTDSNKLKSIYGNNINIIETNGLGLTNEKLLQIKKINDSVGVVIFTDPDGAGNKIRDIISNFLNDKVTHAFITKKDIQNKKKIGIAEANSSAIINALNNALEIKKNDKLSLEWKDYLNLDCFLKSNHNKICEYLNLEKTINNKRLFKWINLFNITKNEVQKILKR